MVAQLLRRILRKGSSLRARREVISAVRSARSGGQLSYRASNGAQICGLWRDEAGHPFGRLD
jgi:hypothetical protein